jgi:hypothetical protein
MSKRMMVAVFAFVFIPLTASAQQQTAISGTVRDASGAVLPGVLVQASSPALIEGAREVVTDSVGVYNIINLRPGTYTVTFTLAGFTTVKREGIVVNTSFTAQVNAELRVGALQETITVAGETPVVDVKSVQSSQVLTADLLEELPTVHNLNQRTALLPSVMVVVPNPTVPWSSNITSHGSQANDARRQIDGMNVAGYGNGGSIEQGLNDGGFEQISVDTGAGSAETASGGVRINAIPKEGGNNLSGTLFANLAPGDLFGDNLTPELKALGLGGTTKISYAFDINPSIGGPIVRDRLWFFSSMRRTKQHQLVTGVLNQTGPVANDIGLFWVATNRITYQATRRDKITVGYEWMQSGAGPKGAASGIGPLTALEAGGVAGNYLDYILQGKWTSTPTNRLLLEAAASRTYLNFYGKYRAEVGPLDVSHFDSFTSKRTVAGTGGGSESWQRQNVTRASASYVTGSHNVKVGMSYGWGDEENLTSPHGDVQQLTFVNGAANAVVVRNTPTHSDNKLKMEVGVYAQDAWTMRRLTLSYGIRWDHFVGEVPAQSSPAGVWVPARQFQAVKNVPNWSNVLPRLGASYDVTGDGRTAIKASISKFVAFQGPGFASTFNPIANQTDSRKWTDFDGNGSPFQTGTFIPQLNEIGPSTNNSFGQPAGVPKLDPDLARQSNWQYSLEVQREILTGVSLTAGYFRRVYYDIGRTINQAVDPETDFTAFTITGPKDTRLPNGGGERITLYNLNPNKQGAVDNIVTYSAENGITYNGFDINGNARLQRLGTIFGGLTLDRTETNNCDVANPNDLRFCKTTTPWLGLYKLGWSSPLIYGFSVNGTLQVTPGSAIEANYSVNNTISVANGGVPLTAGVASITAKLIDPASQYRDSLKTLDLRISRLFTKGRLRARPQLDVYNLFNNSTITTSSNTFGSSWLAPTIVQVARYARVGVQIDF